MGYREEFPGFELPVTIPAGFVDTSWHNDASPSWEHPVLQIRLWIDFEDPAMRELSHLGRYELTWLHPEQGLMAINHSEDFADIRQDIARIAWDVRVAKHMIMNDVMLGHVHPTVTMFEVLHDYVDANAYGGFCDDTHPVWKPPYANADGGMNERGMAVTNAVQNAVHLWLRHGGIAYELARKLGVKVPPCKHNIVDGEVDNVLFG
jgi:hypothetical protein